MRGLNFGMTTGELMHKRPWFTEKPRLPAHVPVGMLGESESLLCFYLAKEAFTGRGTIVDAGSFLGKSAYFFAQGLRANPCYAAGENRVHCFDNFLVNDNCTIRFIDSHLRRRLAAGESTRETFESQVAPIREMLDVHEGDFHTVSWPNQPIEILMVDIAKSESLGKRVIELLFPNLIPGTSLVIQQDYHHPWLPHIHVVMEYLADYFELVAPRVDDSAVFFYRKLIPAEVLRRAIDYDFSYEERCKLIEAAVSRLPPEDRFYVELAGIVLRCGNAEETLLREELNDLEERFHKVQRGYSENPYFTDVRAHIDELEGWRQAREGNYQRSLELADTLLKRESNSGLLVMRGSALIELGCYTEAEHALRLALGFPDRSGHAYVALARALLHQRRFDEAEAELLSGLDDPKAHGATSAHYLTMLEAVLTARNDPAKDCATLSTLRSARPDDSGLRDLESRFHRRWHHADANAPPPQGAPSSISALDAARPAAAEGRPDRPWRKLSLPPTVSSTRSMLSFEEQKYLTWLTEEKFENRGAIVELGCWLGASSVAFAEGLRRRGSETVIRSFDLFRWEPYMEDLAHAGLREGEDFLPLYMQNVGDYARWIRPQKQDLMDYTWSEGPIEILFIDSAKTWDLANAVLKGFGPHLVPGRSRIVLQDFHYPWAHCLPLIFDSRPDVWKQVEEVEEGHTVTFMLLKSLYGPSGISADYSEESFPMESAETLLRSRMARVEPANRYRVLQTLYRKCLIDGPPEETVRLRQEVIAGGVNPADLAVVEDVELVLLPRGWRAYERGDFHLAKAAAERCLSIPGKRSIYALTLLGFSLLRLGLWEQAESAMNEVLSSEPTFPSAKLFRSELAVVRGQYDEAESEALEVLRAGPGDEKTIQWSLNLISQARQLRVTSASSGSALSDLADRLSESPAFLVHLARDQFNAGQKLEAIRNVVTVLNLMPNHEQAAQLLSEWTALSSTAIRPSRMSSD